MARKKLHFVVYALLHFITKTIGMLLSLRLCKYFSESEISYLSEHLTNKNSVASFFTRPINFACFASELAGLKKNQSNK